MASPLSPLRSYQHAHIYLADIMSTKFFIRDCIGPDYPNDTMLTWIDEGRPGAAYASDDIKLGGRNNATKVEQVIDTLVVLPVDAMVLLVFNFSVNLFGSAF